MKKGIEFEHGQALVLFVLAIVVLLGFTALAVDGSMVYSNRRYAQNASDAASLAGGGAAAMSLENSHATWDTWNCNGTRVGSASQAARSASVGRAADNDFTIDQNISDGHGVVTECGEVNHASWREKYLDIHTMITHDTPTAFAHFVFSGIMRNTVETVTRVRPRQSAAFGYAIVALREDCPNSNTGGVHYDGNSDVQVHGGGIFSNACMVKSGGVTVNVDNGTIYCTGDSCWTDNGTSGTVAPAPDSGEDPIPSWAWDIPEPSCSGLPDLGSHHGGGTINPGSYTQIRVNSANDDLVMQPGLYCVSGGISFTGGSVSGNGVTIKMTGGDFDTSGGIQINLSAPPFEGCTYCPPAIPGILIYMPDTNSGEVSLQGNSTSDYFGMVYAPAGTIEAGGTSSELSTIHAQLIGDTVFLHGTTSIDITFDKDQNAQIPTTINLWK